MNKMQECSQSNWLKRQWTPSWSMPPGIYCTPGSMHPPGWMFSQIMRTSWLSGRSRAPESVGGIENGDQHLQNLSPGLAVARAVGSFSRVYMRGTERALLRARVVTPTPCLSFSICALDEYSHWHTSGTQPRHIPSPGWVPPQLGGASSSLVRPDPPSRRCWYEGPCCSGKIREQRQELGQAWACCLPILLGTPARPKAKRV